MTSRDALREVLDGNLCSGCGLCRAVASAGSVEIELSAEGYLRPVRMAPLSDAEDQRIRQVCPGLGLPRPDKDAPYHRDWGPVLSVRTGRAADNELAYRASSGGVLSALLIHLLKTGTIDYVLETGASRDVPTQNETRKTTGYDEVLAAVGSRYAPSAPLATLRERLDQPGRFAIVGKPCDIAALRALAKVDSRIDDKIPIMLSFFCGGVPSTHGTQQILERMGAEKSDVTAFRYRGFGWPGKTTATLRDGTELTMDYNEAWGDILSKHVQLRCKICPDGTGGFADIACADAWHCDEKGYPTFKDADGRSLIISRTNKGEALVRRAMKDGDLLATMAGLPDIETMQPFQARRKRLVISRLLALRLLGQAAPRYRGLQLARASIDAGVWPNIRNFLGMARRILLGRHP
ncbi:MAG: Coenzyme F420 hydrogenase/dehydrogenase, beta subunit C-terminal domain [Alphaproteobacteria bacterium]|nr:Coenzyme F420 hydrogenase/dehydrogenase, beta subunit C-terminal domain [Alphaproteobacteria bacterium]